MTANCYFCNSRNINPLLDLGQQPISNRFLSSREQDEYTYPMVLNQCDDCGLVQINDPVPACELLPPYDWVTYNEPEEHLDRLVETIAALPGINQESNFCGISFKDDSTLTRLQNLGFQHTYRLNPKDDLGISDSAVGVETIQEYLTPDAVDGIVKERGTFDVIIVRHILEHAHDVSRFIKALKGLMNPDGYIIFEAPDCSHALMTCDYTTIWEEHTIYFTPMTFKNCFKNFGLSVHCYECYPYPFENSLIGIVKLSNNKADLSILEEELKKEQHRARNFACNLPLYSAELKAGFSEYLKDQGKVALFGAGHLACTFVNLLGLKDFIDFFVDDNPHKRGLFMPGSKLPIYASSALNDAGIKFCLLSLNPLSEKKVVASNQEFIDRGENLPLFFLPAICLYTERVFSRKG